MTEGLPDVARVLMPEKGMFLVCLPEGFLYSFRQESLYRFFIGEADFRFSRMDIHIDEFRQQIDPDDCGRISCIRDLRVITQADCFHELF